MLLNIPRAYEVMDKYGLDGLVATFPENIYYLTDYWGYIMRMHRPFSHFAVFPRREDAPPTLVTSSKEMNHLTVVPTWVPNIVVYSYRMKDGKRDFDPVLEEPEAEDWLNWPVREGAELSAINRHWLKLSSDAAGRYTATSSWGLRRALRDAGLEKAKVATDDPRIGGWMREMGLPNLQAVDGVNVFREVRMIKSDPEVEIMRETARRNEQALEKTLNAVRVGMAWDELEPVYMAELAKLGGHGVYLSGGPGGLPQGKVVPGEPMMFDALGQFKHYHGDLGRTAVAGEPSREIVARNKAMQVGWQAVQETLRPGLRAGELNATVLDAIRKSGFPGYMLVSPHSVGLEHTDHPLAFGPELPGTHGELVFQKNMVINVDLPYYEIGFGSMHIEDTVRITDDGCEVLTSGNAALRVVAG